jgi:hypothetical protein
MSSHNSGGRDFMTLLSGRKGEIDVVDSLLIPLVAVALAVLTGAGTFSMFGIDAGAQAFSVSGYSMSWAGTIALGGMVIAYLTNQPNYEEWANNSTYVAVVGVASVVLIELYPAAETFVTGSDMIALATMAVQAAALYMLAYW